MNEQRITTIVKEIEYWKEHKILPDEQCDFLLAIYTNGEKSDYIKPSERKRILKQDDLLIKVLQITLLFMMLPFSFLVLYFTEFHSYLQMGILTLFLIYAVWIFTNVKERKSVIYQVSLLVSLLILLLLTISAVNFYFPNPVIINLVIGLNFLLWFILGSIFKVKYLIITSISGILFIIFYTIS